MNPDLNLQEVALLKQREVEAMFAGALFIHPTWTVQTCGWLATDSLADERIKKYWTLARDRIAPGTEPERAAEISVAAALEAEILTDVMLWSEQVRAPAEPLDFAREIDRRRILSSAGALAGRLAIAIRDQDDLQVRAIAKELTGLEGARPSEEPDLQTIATRFADVVTTRQRSIETMIPPIDSAIAGLERQTLTILAARPGMGKTALSLQIALLDAEAGYKVDVFSMEMSAISLWARVACPQVGVVWRDVRSGAIPEPKRAELIQVSYDLAERYKDTIRIVEGRRTTDEVWRMVAERRPDLVIADHLRLFKDRADSEVKRMGNVTERLKDIAVAFDAAVLADAQLSRAVESRQDKRPMLSDLRDSGEIEENADLVLMLYRDDYYNPPEIPNPHGSPTELWVRKFREGKNNQGIELLFVPSKEIFIRHDKGNLNDY